MVRVVELIERVCDNPSNILITGESGTGKELVARLIHYNGHRREKAFVPINCAAIPENLLESELFGYQKGAFTDAKVAKKGLFLEADGGTLFLDEVAEMAPSVQAKVLRAVEDREIRPLGETKGLKVDARIISTSKKDLRISVKQGTFREDLCFRLNVIEIKLPPLRERREDIPPLINFFIGKYNGQLGRRISGISPGAMKALMEYPWPGNARELENAIEHAVSLARDQVITAEDLPSFLEERDSTPDLLARAAKKQSTVAELEREYITGILEQTGGNKSRAAQILGMDRKTLYRKLQEYQIERE
ncbi:MAG: sigma-54 interaction domain-containing protein, partial [Thermodesulfobacteriota bacterium]